MNTVTIRPAISGTGRELTDPRTGAQPGAVVMHNGRAYVRVVPAEAVAGRTTAGWDDRVWRGEYGLTYLLDYAVHNLIHMPDGTGRHRKNVGPVESKLSFPFEPWRGRHSR